ncbi:MAG TPA: ABC transporter substrate-binding protein, partial [Chloroflexota bacterium]|nr:ABC transporter substrate-binding protein [Chloroflexota bacterium]
MRGIGTLLMVLSSGSLLLAACGGGMASAPPAAAPPRQAAGPASPAPAAAAPAPAAPAPLTTLKAGQTTASAYPFYIGIERGYYREVGIELEYDQFRSGTETVPMLAQGQLDVIQHAVIPGTFNALVRGVPMKAILDASHAAPDQRSHATVVRKELADSGAVRTLADLVGRKFATSSLVGALGIDVDRGMRQYGRQVEDLDLVVLSFPDMPPALANGSVDAAVMVEPAISAALNLNAGVVLRWLSEDYPGHQIAAQVIGPSLVERPDLARRFAQGYLRGARDWNDAIEHGVGVDDLARLLAPYNNLDVAVNADL